MNEYLCCYEVKQIKAPMQQEKDCFPVNDVPDLIHNFALAKHSGKGLVSIKSVATKILFGQLRYLKAGISEHFTDNVSTSEH